MAPPARTPHTGRGGGGMAFVLSRRLEVKPWELDAAIEDAVEIARRFEATTGLPVVLLQPVGCDVVGALWVTQFAPDLESLAAAQSAFAALSDARARLNQLWQQRLTGPIVQQLYEVVRGETDGGDDQLWPYYAVTRARTAMGELGEALGVAFDFAELVELHAGRPSIVTTAYTGPFLEAVITVGHAGIAEYEAARRAVQLDPALAPLLKRATSLQVSADLLLLERIAW